MPSSHSVDEIASLFDSQELESSQDRKNLFVKREVVPEGNVSSFILQQTIASDNCSNYDDCYNDYSETIISNPSTLNNLHELSKPVMYTGDTTESTL